MGLAQPLVLSDTLQMVPSMVERWELTRNSLVASKGALCCLEIGSAAHVATITSLDAISATGAEPHALMMAQQVLEVAASGMLLIRDVGLRQVPSGDDVSWGDAPMWSRGISGEWISFRN